MTSRTILYKTLQHLFRCINTTDTKVKKYILRTLAWKLLLLIKSIKLCAQTKKFKEGLYNLENKLFEKLDDLNIKDVSLLLEKDINLSVGHYARKRIEKSVNKKTGYYNRENMFIFTSCKKEHIAGKNQRCHV